MHQVHLFAFGFPFCQKNEGEQTASSKALRVTAIIIGIIAIIIGSLIIAKTPGLAHLNSAYGRSILTLGIVLALSGISIKYIKKNIDIKVDVKPTDVRASDDRPEHNNLDVTGASSYQSRQRQKIEADLTAKLNLAAKRKEQIDWYEKTNKEKEEEYSAALANLKGKNLPAPVEKKQIEFLTNKYKRDQEVRKQSLDDYLLNLENTNKDAMRLAKTLGGDNK